MNYANLASKSLRALPVDFIEPEIIPIGGGILVDNDQIMLCYQKKDKGQNPILYLKRSGGRVFGTFPLQYQQNEITELYNGLNRIKSDLNIQMKFLLSSENINHTHYVSTITFHMVFKIFLGWDDFISTVRKIRVRV